MSRSKKRRYDPTENLGIQHVTRVLTGFGWIVRDGRQDDFGVDLDAEHVAADGKPTGRRIYVQVKSGRSYFAQSNRTYVHHYTDAEHVEYWSGHPAPVAIVLHDEAASLTIWAWTSEAVEVGKTWRISIPRTQTLDAAAKAIWSARALENRRIDPANVEEIGREVEQEIKKPAAAGSRSTAFQTHDDPAAAIQSLAQASLGDGALSQAAMAQLSQLFEEKLKAVRSPVLQPEADQSQSVDRRRVHENPALHAQIDQLREIKNEGDPDVAHRKLEALIPKIDASAQPYAYFRARTIRAACALAIGLEQAAIEELIQVWEIEKTNPQAIANLAMARLFQRDYRSAYDAALECLSHEDAPPHVLGALFGAAARLDLEQPPLALIPEKHRDSSDAEFALTEYQRVKSDPSWIERAISGYEKYPDEPAFKRLWMYAILEQAASDRQAYPGGRISVPLDALEAAADALRTDVERKIAAGYHDKEDLADQATNAAVAYRVLDDYQPGIDLLRRVLQYTGHQPNAARMLGLLEAMHGNEDAALEVFRTVPDDGEAQLLAAEIIGQRNPGEGLAHVLAIPEDAIPDHHRHSRWVITARLAINLGDEVQVQSAIDELRKGQGFGPLADIFSAKLRQRQGARPEDLARDLIAAAERLPPDAPLSARLSLAEELWRYDAPLPASRLLDGFIDPSRDTDASHLYIRLLATSGRDQDFYRAFEELPASARNKPEMIWLKSAHAFNHGDLDEADRQTQRLAKLQPTDLKPVLLNLEALIRLRREKQVRVILDSTVESLVSTDLNERVRLGRILIGFGYHKRGLNLLYRLLLENRDNPRFWVNFGSAVLVSSRQKDEMFNVPVVTNDASVTLQFESGATAELVVEPDPEFRRLDPDAREPDHPDILALLGLAAGAEFRLPDGRSGTISDLRHKFIARMQIVLKQFEERFPAANGFKSVPIDVEKEGGLDEIKAILKARADFVTEEARSYETGNLPLAVFAHRVGITTIDAAGGLAQTGRKFQVALGSPEERREAVESVKANAAKGAVVDAQTFDTIWALGAVEVVEGMVGKLHYAISTMDILQSRLEMIEGSADDENGYQSMAYQNGQIALTSVSPEDVQRQREDQRRAIEWLGKNGVLCPVNLPDDLADDFREAMAGFDKPLLDELLIAKERELLLLVDDLHIRHWARGFVKHSAWLHALFGYATDEGKADLAAYTLWSARLLARGQNYLGLSQQVFIQALEDDVKVGLKAPGDIFHNLTRCLGGTSADLQSHLRVVCQVIFLVWKSAQFDDLKQQATSILLRAVISQRHDDYRSIIAVVLRVFRHEYAILDYLRGWARGHFVKLD